MPRTARSLLILVMVAVGGVGLASCDGTPRTWTSSIKRSRVTCDFFGKYIPAYQAPAKVDVRCVFKYAGSGERPYVKLRLNGCGTNRLNGSNNSVHHRIWTSCTNDPTTSIRFQLCQTRGGIFPDDCASQRQYEF